ALKSMSHAAWITAACSGLMSAGSVNAGGASPFECVHSSRRSRICCAKSVAAILQRLLLGQHRLAEVLIRGQHPRRPAHGSALHVVAPARAGAERCRLRRKQALAAVEERHERDADDRFAATPDE